MAMNEKLHILVVEDNAVLAAQLLDFLQQKGLVTDYAATGQLAQLLMQQQQFDLVILDLTLPDVDGLVLCQQFKQSAYNPPVLMLTARDSLQDKISGFEVGADDYLTKPFALEEVYFRVLALCRRHRLHQSPTLLLGDLTIDRAARQASRGGVPLNLSATDFSLLQLLAEAYPHAVSKRQLNAKLWGDDAPESDAVRSHIYTLRHALDKPFASALLKTVHGIGFRLELPDAGH